MTDPNHIMRCVLLMHCMSKAELLGGRKCQNDALSDLVGLISDQGYSNGYIADLIGARVSTVEGGLSEWRTRSRLAREAIRWAVSQFRNAGVSALPPIRREKSYQAA